jgi:hypothetical protein
MGIGRVRGALVPIGVAPRSVGPFIQRHPSDADEGGSGGDRQTDEERQRGRGAVDPTLDSDKLCERHDEIPLLYRAPGERGRPIWTTLR